MRSLRLKNLFFHPSKLSHSHRCCKDGRQDCKRTLVIRIFPLSFQWLSKNSSKKVELPQILESVKILVNIVVPSWTLTAQGAKIAANLVVMGAKHQHNKTSLRMCLVLRNLLKLVRCKGFKLLVVSGLMNIQQIVLSLTTNLITWAHKWIIMKAHRWHSTKGMSLILKNLLENWDGKTFTSNLKRKYQYPR